MNEEVCLGPCLIPDKAGSRSYTSTNRLAEQNMLLDVISV